MFILSVAEQDEPDEALKTFNFPTNYRLREVRMQRSQSESEQDSNLGRNQCKCPNAETISSLKVHFLAKSGVKSAEVV